MNAPDESRLERCEICDSLFALWFDYPGEPVLLDDIERHWDECKIHRQNHHRIVALMIDGGHISLARMMTLEP